MRIAVFSDIHGNPYACEAVLQAVKKEGCDAVLAAGDLCLGGSQPEACLDLLRAADVKAVYGNTEVYLREPDNIPPDELHRSMWDKLQPPLYWVRSRLTTDQLAWLEELPFEIRFPAIDRTMDELLVVHANPKNVELMILPPAEEQMKLWGEIRQPDNDPELASVFQGESARIVAYGHFHYSSTRFWNGFTLVGVACCSMPQIDHDWRARFTTFTREKDTWVIERRWVEYNTSRELRALVNSDMPNKEGFLRYFK